MRRALGVMVSRVVYSKMVGTIRKLASRAVNIRFAQQRPVEERLNNTTQGQPGRAPQGNNRRTQYVHGDRKSCARARPSRALHCSSVKIRFARARLINRTRFITMRPPTL